MASPNGAAAPALAPLLEKLQKAPYSFDFFQALRLLERAFPDAPRLGQSVRIADEPVRLSQEPSLKFAPAAVAGFGPAGDSRRNQLRVHFFGLCGPNGALQ